MSVSEWCEWGIGGWVGKGSKDVFDVGKDQVVGGGEWHGYFGGEPDDGITNSFAAGFPHPHFVTPIRF